MDFTEFKRQLGAEPRSDDPEFVAARDESPEHRQAAIDAERFEKRLEQALDIPVPADLASRMLAAPGHVKRRPRWPVALAAAVLVAIGAAAVFLQAPRTWDSVESYVMEHYRHDGAEVLERAAHGPHGDVQEILGSFGLKAEPALAGMVRLVKYCPSPGGKGVHMVLDTQTGPVTVFYLPETEVNDRQVIAFDGRQALLVSLEQGSAVIVGSASSPPVAYYSVVQEAIVPANRSS